MDSYNIMQLAIDSRPYRTHVNSRKIWYLKPASRKCKCMHITQDYHDKAKHLTTMAMHQVNYNEEICYYYLDIKARKVLNLRKHHIDNINYKYVVKTTYSKALKKLQKELSK